MKVRCMRWHRSPPHGSLPLERHTAFDRMLSSMKSLPLLTKFSVTTAAAEASEVNEGSPKPLTRLSLTAGDALTPRKTTAVVVLSDELARAPGSLDLIDAELQAAVAAGVDGSFLSDMVSSTTPIASAGSSAANTVTDIAGLLAAVSLGARSSPFFIFSAASLKAMATNIGSGRQIVWPSVTWNGGTLAGIPAISSDALPAGTALLLDAAQIAANGGEVRPSTTRQASLEMVDSESMDSSPEASDIPISLWQHGMVGVRVERTFAYRLLRSTAAASLSGVAY